LGIGDWGLGISLIPIPFLSLKKENISVLLNRRIGSINFELLNGNK
jgi:hypothetical protein